MTIYSVTGFNLVLEFILGVVFVLLFSLLLIWGSVDFCLLGFICSG